LVQKHDISWPNFRTIVDVEIGQQAFWKRSVERIMVGLVIDCSSVLYIMLCVPVWFGLNDWSKLPALSFSPPVYLTKCFVPVLFFHFYIDRWSIIITFASVVRTLKTQVRQLVFKQHSLTETRTSRNKIAYR